MLVLLSLTHYFFEQREGKKFNLQQLMTKTNKLLPIAVNSVAEPHHFYAATAPGKNFDAAPAPAPTLLYSKAKFLK
jgi:hypothetical protein